VPELNAAPDAATRRAIIAKSPKSHLLILDFLWLTEKLDLIAPVDLVARNDAVAQKARENPQDGDVIDLEAAAERDLLASLEKAAAANKGKKGRTIDPLALAVSINATDLASYEPKEKWEWKAPTINQVARLKDAGIDMSHIHTAGMASKMIGILDQRKALGLCSPKQMTFLAKHGKEELHALGIEDPAMATAEDARKILFKKTMQWKHKKHFKTAKKPAANPTLFQQ
jgi:hypothetical protein